MRTTRLTLPLLLALSTVTVAACDGCAEDPGEIKEDDRNDLPPNTGDGDDEEPQPEPRELIFDGTSPVEVFHGAQVTLPFRLMTRGGAKVPGEVVRFALSGTAGTIDVTEAFTDNNAIARVVFTAGTADGDVVITASAELAPDEAVSVRVKLNPYGTLKVNLTSTTRIPVTRADVLVYRGVQQNVPTCAYLDTAATLPAATFAADVTPLPGSRTFTNQDHGHRVTVLTAAYSSAGDLIGMGCVDGNGIVGGQTTTVSVAIAQLPSILDGDYDVLMNVDLGNALPEPYDGYLDMVTGILSDPGGYAVYMALIQLDESWGTDFIYIDSDNDGYTDRPATWDEVIANPSSYGTWLVASDLTNQILTNTLGQTYTDVTTVGGDIRQAVTAFEVGTRLAVTEQEGFEGVYTVDEKWNDLVFTWSLNCADGDLGCARRPIELDETNYAPVATQYSAWSTHRPTVADTERFEVLTEPHLFALRYGAIIMIAMNEVVFPNLPGGLASDDGLEGVMGNIINCADVGQSIADAIGMSSMGGTMAGMCELGLGAIATAIEDRVLQLEVGSGNPELEPKDQTGALGGGKWFLIDKNKNLATELVKDLEMQVQWNDAEDGQNSDILAPIVGEGREAADRCDADAACDEGQFCAPIAHYLKVKATENTCVKQVGAGLGEDSCTAHNQCGSGVCVGFAAGNPGTCFSACTSDDACGAGVCSTTAHRVDLDPVMNGLGDADVASCVIPD